MDPSKSCHRPARDVSKDRRTNSASWLERHASGKSRLSSPPSRIWNRSPPFTPSRCSWPPSTTSSAPMPRDLLESQLFGHRRGAFTGADRDNPGVIRSARDGTLFLDEIGELSLDLQPKLLRFLESGEICPLGDSTPFIVNLRVVAATNSNLEQA